MVKIIDKRKINTQIPAVSILNQAIPVLKKKNFAGIRNIILYDEDRRKGKKALGTYYPLSPTRADIKIYFNWYYNLPDELKNSDTYLMFAVIKILLHEIYHHIVHGQDRLKTPDPEQEEKDADRWADGGARYVFDCLFTNKDYKKEFKRIRNLIKKYKEKASVDSVPQLVMHKKQNDKKNE